MRKLTKHILTAKVSLVMAIAFTMLLLYLSLMPAANLPDLGINQVDKLYHFTAYVLFSFLWFIYACLFRKIQKNLTFNSIVIALILFGIVVEVLQKILTDNRMFDWWDILSNSAGILIVYFFFKYHKTKLGKLSQQLNV